MKKSVPLSTFVLEIEISECKIDIQLLSDYLNSMTQTCQHMNKGFFWPEVQKDQNFLNCFLTCAIHYSRITVDKFPFLG